MVAVARKKIPNRIRTTDKKNTCSNPPFLEVFCARDYAFPSTEEFCGSQGSNEIQQGIRNANIQKHVWPFVDKAHEGKDNRGLGTDDADTYYPVQNCWPEYAAVKREHDQKTQYQSDDQKEIFHIIPFLSLPDLIGQSRVKGTGFSGQAGE
jgi:hypothetical protein